MQELNIRKTAVCETISEITEFSKFSDLFESIEFNSEDEVLAALKEGKKLKTCVWALLDYDPEYIHLVEGEIVYKNGRIRKHNDFAQFWTWSIVSG